MFAAEEWGPWWGRRETREKPPDEGPVTRPLPSWRHVSEGNAVSLEYRFDVLIVRKEVRWVP